MEDRMEFNILFPPFLREAVEETARRNRRSLSAELTIAAERYIEADATDAPPDYPPGDLKRTKIWIPRSVHEAISGIAEARGWSRNRVLMAAAYRHVKNGGAP